MKATLKTHIARLPYAESLIIPIVRYARKVLYGFALLPVVLLLKTVSLFVKIRIGFLCIGRIGHLALDLDIYNSYRYRNQNKYTGTIDFFFTQNRIANKYLLDMWKRNNGYHIINSKWLSGWPLVDIIKRNKIFNELYIDLKRIELDGLTVGMPSFVHIDSESLQRCKEKCCEMGISNQFVCIHNRDSQFLNKTLQVGEDPNYHDYRDSSICNYFDASNELSKKGYTVVRVGRIAKDRVLSPSIIDYAFKPDAQSDEMDIYLLSKAFFTISTNTGITHIPAIFRKKQLCVNFLPFLPTTLCFITPESIIIPKKLWHTKWKRFLNFSELMSFETTVHNTECPYRANYLEPIENTSEEIMDAAIEIDDRMNGRGNEYDDFEELQELFWNIAPDTKGWRTVIEKFKFRIGSKFLYNNRDIIK